jgi:hypothetical protein
MANAQLFPENVFGVLEAQNMLRADQSRIAVTQELVNKQHKSKYIGTQCQFVHTSDGDNSRVHGVLLRVNDTLYALSLDDVRSHCPSYNLPQVGTLPVIVNYDITSALQREPSDSSMETQPPSVEERNEKTVPSGQTSPYKKKKNQVFKVKRPKKATKSDIFVKRRKNASKGTDQTTQVNTTPVPVNIIEQAYREAGCYQCD